MKGSQSDEYPRSSRFRTSLKTIPQALFSVSIATVVLALVLLLADILIGWHLPQPIRPVLPIVLAAALCVALVLGVSAFGAPQRPGGSTEIDPERDESD